MIKLSESECSVSPTFIGPDNCCVCQIEVCLGKCQACRSSPPIGWEHYRLVRAITPEDGSTAQHTGVIQTDSKLRQNERSVSLVRTNGQCRIASPDPRGMTPREVVAHNKAVGWDEWLIIKDKVYSARQLRELLVPLISLTGGGFEKDATDDKQLDNVNKSYCNSGDDFSENFPCQDEWDIRTVKLIIRKVMLNKKTDLGRYLSCCSIGYITQPPAAGYWDDVRHDIRIVLNDLTRAAAEGKISAYMSEYMRLLQRWLNNYRHQNPKHLQWSGQDINTSPFPLPQEINGTFPALRDWLDSWVPFDTEIPDGGAWPVYDVHDFDIGDPHEIFASSLKSRVDLTCLDMSIEGEVAWDVIQVDLFANDVLTPEQEMTEQERRQRTDLCDPRRMATRREELLHYFVWKYNYDFDNVRHFLGWAETMAEGESRFLNIC